MNLKSLGYRMDLAYPDVYGEVLHRDDYIVIRSPKLPGYFWGNYLLFADPPQPGDLQRWRDLYEQEVASEGVEHEAFGWDSPTGEWGDVAPFEAAGFRRSETSVMRAHEIGEPPHLNADVIVQPAVSDPDWETASDCSAGYTGSADRNLRIEAKLAALRKRSQTNEGNWYAASLDGQIVGGLGIYKADNTAVVDDVSTHPDFRGKGVARTAVYVACRHALDSMSINNLVLMADEGSAAQRMYEQLGFRIVETQVGILRTE